MKTHTIDTQNNSLSDKEFDFILKYIQETNSEMRHLEDVRNKISSIVIAIIVGVLSFLDKDLWIYKGTFISSLSVFGMFFTQKVYQLHNRGQERLNCWYSLLENKYNIVDVFIAKREADSKHNKSKWLNFLDKNVHHNILWVILYAFILLIGISLIIR